MSILDRIPLDDAAEMRRLCAAYEDATGRADVAQARAFRGSISDLIAKAAAGDAGLEADLRRELCFPVEVSPNLLDQ